MVEKTAQGEDKYDKHFAMKLQEIEVRNLECELLEKIQRNRSYREILEDEYRVSAKVLF